MYVIVAMIARFMCFCIWSLNLWISAYDSDILMHASEVWRVTPGSGFMANCILAAGLLGFFGLIILERGREKGTPRREGEQTKR
jgi:hypothetical protein